MKKTCFYLSIALAFHCWWSASSQTLDRSNVPLLETKPENRSYRRCSTTACKDLSLGCCSFTDKGGLQGTEQRHFSTLTFNDNFGLLVGAMDAAYVLDYSLKLQGKISLDSPSRDDCISILRRATSLPQIEEYRCHNHIRHFDILPGRDPETLFICGTSAYHPSCSYVETRDLLSGSSVLSTGDKQIALGLIPTDPALFYTGMMRNFDATDTVLVTGLTLTSTRNFGTIGFQELSVDGTNTASATTLLRTDPNEDSFIESPQIIVDIFEHDYTIETDASGAQDLMFVVFQESNINSWRSRIARVCKNDTGSSMLSGEIPNVDPGTYYYPVTFVKAGISCKVAAKNTLTLDYHYNRIFDFELVTNSSYGPDEADDMIGYGLFADTGLQPSGSAVCVYRASRTRGNNGNNGVYDIFTRQFVGGNNDGLTCADGGLSRRTSGQNNREIQANMDQIGDAPLFVLEGVSLTKLQVDPQQPVIRNGNVDYQDVMFGGSTDGRIYKIFMARDTAGGGMKPVVSEIIQLNDASQVYKLLIKNTSDGRFLFATTNTSVYRLPLQNCQRLNCCSECLAVRDPYCGYDMASGRCVAITADSDPKNILQSVDDVAMVTPMCGDCKPDEVTSLPPKVDSVVSTSPPSSGAIIPVSIVTALFILLCAVLVVALVIMVILFLRARNLEGGVSLNSKFGAVESGNQTEKQTGKQNGDQTGKQNGDQTGKQTGYQGDNYYDEVPEKGDHVYANDSAQESV